MGFGFILLDLGFGVLGVWIGGCSGFQILMQFRVQFSESTGTAYNHYYGIV